MRLEALRVSEWRVVRTVGMVGLKLEETQTCNLAKKTKFRAAMHPCYSDRLVLQTLLKTLMYPDMTTIQAGNYS